LWDAPASAAYSDQVSFRIPWMYVRDFSPMG
jgi:hypothetical protein